MSRVSFERSVCECCGQTRNYVDGVNRGSAEIVKIVARAIRDKGINVVHIRKELVEVGAMRPTQYTNVAHPTAHGLIAKVRGNPGNYCLTRKGAAFLRGEPIPRYAIIDKATKHTVGYHEPERYTVTLAQVQRSGDYWEGVGFDVVEGRVVLDLQK